MTGQQELPMGRHDMEALAGGEQAAAFERYVSVKRELLEVLQKSLAKDEMLESTQQD